MSPTSSKTIYGQIIEYRKVMDDHALGASHTSPRDSTGSISRPILPMSVLTYVEDRLYLASYTSPPTADTLFPYPTESSAKRSPHKRSAKAIDGPTLVSKKHQVPPYYFCVDDTLLYNAFHHDFGPFHIGHLYRFAVYLHDILGAPENQDRPVVFWSKADARSRANAACILACYMVLIQSWPPHLALAPIAQADPPLMPFRDAGYSQADYGITIQDVIYGIWRAKEEGVCQLPQFNLEEYERYERVDEGDFNWVTPDFLAFASPQHAPVAPIAITSPLYATLPSTLEAVDAHPTLPQPFKNVLKHFSERNIGLVVRLNSELYSPSFFTALGIKHLDMIFDDGTCPTLAVVRKFITLAHETITVHGKGIAVHCKAGLGRTGCLIGAYLIYRYGFTASEIIAFMRFMRPGMVVGPQQHWLHLNQGTFRRWWVTEQYDLEMRAQIEQEIKAKLAAKDPSTPTKVSKRFNLTSSSQVATPPNGGQARRAPLGEVDNERNSIGCQDDCLPAPTPGQPRKTSRVDHLHPYSRSVSKYDTSDEDQVVQKETEIISIHRQSHSENREDEEEWQLRMRTSTRSSRSPGRSETRTLSQTTSFYHSIDNDSSNDAENIGAPRPKTPGSMKSGSGSRALGMKVRASPKRSGDASRGEKSAGVRKTSGRVGSVGTGPGTVQARKVSGL